MRRVKRAAEFMLNFVLFPLALLFLVLMAIAVGKGLAIYLAGLLSAWLLFAFVLPLLMGMITPGEILANIRSRRRSRTHFEGEPLPDRYAGRDPPGNRLDNID